MVGVFGSFGGIFDWWKNSKKKEEDEEGETPIPTTPPALEGVPLNRGAAYDFLLGNSPYITAPQQAGANQFRTYQIKDSPVIRWEMYLRDFYGGGDQQIVEIADGIMPNKLAHSELDHRYPRTLCLLPLTTTDTTAANLMNQYNRLGVGVLKAASEAAIVGGGSTANQGLFLLGSSVTPQTYTPTSNITCIAMVHIGGTNVQRIIIGRDSDVAQILSDFDGSPTVDGSMHADTEPLYGVIESPLNSGTSGATTLLLYAKDGIWALSSTAAISDAPVAVLSEIPEGGYALGIAEIEGSKIRAYWVWPLSDTTNSVGQRSNEIWSTNLEGDDPQKLEIGLNYIQHAMKWREGIVATDGNEVIWHNGRKVNLNFNRDRVARTAGCIFRVNGFAALGPRLFVHVSEYFTAFTSTGPHRYSWWEEYLPEENAWYPATTRVNQEASNSTPIALFTNDTNGIFDSEGRFWWYGHTDNVLTTEDHAWFNVQLASGNPFSIQKAGGEMFYAFATTGFCETPAYHFYEGFPKVVTDIWYGGELIGEDSSVRVEVATQDASAMRFAGDTLTAGGSASTQGATFKEDDRMNLHYWQNPKPEMVDRIKLKITVTQGTSGSGVTKTSPNALPLVIGGYIYLDRQEHPMHEIEPWRVI